MWRRLLHLIVVLMVLSLLLAFAVWLIWMGVNLARGEKLLDPIGAVIIFVFGLGLTPLFIYILIRSTAEISSRVPPPAIAAPLWSVARFTLGCLGLAMILFAILGAIGTLMEGNYFGLMLWAGIFLFGIELTRNLASILRGK